MEMEAIRLENMGIAHNRNSAEPLFVMYTELNRRNRRLEKSMRNLPKDLPLARRCRALLDASKRGLRFEARL